MARSSPLGPSSSCSAASVSRTRRRVRTRRVARALSRWRVRPSGPACARHGKDAGHQALGASVAEIGTFRSILRRSAGPATLPRQRARLHHTDFFATDPGSRLMATADVMQSALHPAGGDCGEETIRSDPPPGRVSRAVALTIARWRRMPFLLCRVPLLRFCAIVAQPVVLSDKFLMVETGALKQFLLDHYHVRAVVLSSAAPFPRRWWTTAS